MSTLKQIKAMSREELRHLHLNLLYGRATGGFLSHFWTSPRRTLCNKDLYKNPRYYGALGRGLCEVCKQRKDLIVQRRQELRGIVRIGDE